MPSMQLFTWAYGLLRPHANGQHVRLVTRHKVLAGFPISIRENEGNLLSSSRYDPRPFIFDISSAVAV